MKLSPHELDKINNLHTCGAIAQRRLARGIRLNVPEVKALLSLQIIELARKGGYTVAQLMDICRSMIGRRQVLPGIASMIDEVQIEATFLDGTKLVTVHNPIHLIDGDLEMCLRDSFLPIPSLSLFIEMDNEELIPGEIITCSDAATKSVTLNAGKDIITINVINTADRPIQIGSHFHFIETNKKLLFDRMLSYGYRLNIPAGTAARFEPGESKHVSLVAIGGDQVISGGNGIATGKVDRSNALRLSNIKKSIAARGFLDVDTSDTTDGDDNFGTFRNKKQKTDVAYREMTRGAYAKMYGPTTGDLVRLADTNLFIKVERDCTVYGDECKFGGGKVLREGMGQASAIPLDKQLDTVIINALIVDYSGIYKADIGVKNGLISGIGKAGNPDVMDGVDDGMIIGGNTEVISAEGCIITAGGIDTHIHYICPDICNDAIASGITTMVGGGTGPASGSLATTCTPGPFHMRMMMESTDALPINMGFTGKGNVSSPEGLVDIIAAGAVGLKLHEDWGTTISAIDNCLSIADQYDVQVTIHTDTLNESSCVEDTIEAFKGRTIHAYHTEGAGGGHAPDIITVCSHPNVIPSSTNPTRPFTINTAEEHLDMLMVCHHLSKYIPEDISFAESRIRQETIAAEDILHDMGAISIMSSDSQAMGRVGETVIRTWQTADKMKKQRGTLTEDLGHGCDNYRVKRYISKYTINPAIAHGMSDIIGSIEVGKLADIIMYKPAYFGVRPEIIVKGGHIAWAQMGESNASIPTTQPIYMRPMFGSVNHAASHSSLLFVSPLCYQKGLPFPVRKKVHPIKNVRSIGKKDMVFNDAMPDIEVDPETFTVTADGVALYCEPAHELPLSQRYFMV